MKKITATVLSVLLLVLAGACSGVRNCTPPVLNLPETFGAAAADSVSAADSEWWEFYGDSTLVALIRHTLENNRDLMAAAARVEQARQLYGVDRLNLAPTVSGQLYADHETNDYHGEGSNGDPEYGFKVTVAWEADLWGGLSWARKRGQAAYLASEFDRQAMKVALIAETASAYYRLVALDGELAIARRTLMTRQENLNKAKLRYEGGLTPETVYQQAVVEYNTTAALIPGIERQLELVKNAICLLAGEYPGSEIARHHIILEDMSSPGLPAGIPSELLKRRPDLLASEARLRQALAQAGVAYADRFPRLRIGLTGGLENDELSTFIKSPFSYVIGSVAGTIIDFGKNKRRHRAAEAAYNAAKYEYEQDVLTAFSEVADARSNLRLAHESRLRRAELYEAAQKYATLAFAQYNGGVIAYIDVLDAQRRYYEAQVNLNNALRDENLARVELYKVLGGGWNPESGTEQ